MPEASRTLFTGNAMNNARLPSQGSPDVSVEALVRERTDELFELVTHLQRIHEEEKRLIARELHDELGSLLTAIKLDITYIKTKCAKSAPELDSKCERVASMVDQGAALKRRLIDQLHPSTLDLLGLGPALRELVDGFVSETRIAAQVEVDDDVVPRGDPALVLYRVIEASLMNIRDHAHATNVLVTITKTPDALTLRISDDGNGLESEMTSRAAVNGMAAIRQRIASVGGNVTIAASPGSGTVMSAKFPTGLAGS